VARTGKNPAFLTTVTNVRLSRTLLSPAHRANASARYRVDFFAEVKRSGAGFRSAPEATWWLVDRVYVEDAQAPEVLAWAQMEAGEDGLFAVYVEQRVVREDGELLVIGLIAGEDPIPPPVV
jgi:hypothetical protein